MKLGAIDVGSNAIRVVIGEVSRPLGSWNYSKLAYLRLPVRLGDDVFDKGKISDSKVEQFVEGMKIFRSYLDFYGVTDFRAVATSAMRDSSNSKRILQKIKKETGITLEVISGKEEAELVYTTFQLISGLKNNYLLIDVGGGSTEITLFENNKVHKAKSFQIGSVRLLKGKVQDKEWKALENWIKKEIKPTKPGKVFGAGGTINSIHKVLGAKDKEPISKKSIVSLSNTLGELDIEQRILNFKLKPDRADVLIPAMEIYTTILNLLDVKEIFVPKMGVSDGVILSLYRERTL